VQRGVDPRLLVSLAVAWLGCMSLVRSHWTSGSDFWTLVMPVLLQGLGMSFFMLPLTTITLNSVPPEELASATGMQNFTRTITLGIATALVLTMWSNGQQESRSEIVSRLQPDDAMRTLASNGMSTEQAMRTISSMVDRDYGGGPHLLDHISVIFSVCRRNLVGAAAQGLRGAEPGRGVRANGLISNQRFNQQSAIIRRN
jgi:hypothetical protein